jgi:hypothetical protein
VEFFIGDALFRMGRAEEAVGHYKKGLGLYGPLRLGMPPRLRESFSNMKEAFTAEGLHDEAFEAAALERLLDVPRVPAAGPGMEKKRPNDLY